MQPRPVRREQDWAVADQSRSMLPAQAAPMPMNVRPMLARLVDKPFDRADWIFEIKWVGYRIMAEVDKGASGSTRATVSHSPSVTRSSGARIPESRRGRA